jgi:microsomal dipeptidase-like Zn-dependent dipeptidase
MFPLRIILPLVLLLPSLARAQVDLHAHLLMKTGMGPALIGDHHAPPSARSPMSRLPSRASLLSLEEADAPRVVVVSLYAHAWLSRPWFPGLESNVSRALLEEYRQLTDFIGNRADRLALVRNPAEAEAALATGKRAIVLSIEGAFGAIREGKDLDEWIERGLSILTPFHLTEDRFGGVALMRPIASLFNTPFSFLERLIGSGGGCLKTLCKSPVGMSENGRALLRRLREKGVWIDLAHANDLEVEELLPEFRRMNLPILVTHTSTREAFPAERSLQPELIEEVVSGKNDGIFGLIPSADMLPEPESVNGCTSSSTEFLRMVSNLTLKLGEKRLAIGSDANAPLRGLTAGCGGNPHPAYVTYADLAPLSAAAFRSPSWKDEVIEHFLNLWQRVRPVRPASTGTTVPGSNPRSRQGSPPRNGSSRNREVPLENPKPSR